MNQNTLTSRLPDQYAADLAVDRFGLRVASQLSVGAAQLDHDISERLRVARRQALSKAREVRLGAKSASSIVSTGGGSLALGGDAPGLWDMVASFFPLLVLVVGLVGISIVQDDRRAAELAEIDAALLTDDLPPAAYADPGFVQFLKSRQPGADARAQER